MPGGFSRPRRRLRGATFAFSGPRHIHRSLRAKKQDNKRRSFCVVWDTRKTGKPALRAYEEAFSRRPARPRVPRRKVAARPRRKSSRPAPPRVTRRKAAARPGPARPAGKAAAWRFCALPWRSPSGEVGFRASPWRSPSGGVGFRTSPWRIPSSEVGFRASPWRSPSDGVGFCASPWEREGRVRFLHIDSRRPPRPLAKISAKLPTGGIPPKNKKNARKIWRVKKSTCPCGQVSQILR